MGFGEGTPALLAVMVIVAGAVLGVVNTVLTEAVMRIAPVERPIASSAYSFVRFAGGAVAPWLAGKLAEWVAPDDAVLRRRRRGRRSRCVVLLAGRAYFVEERRGRGRDRAGARRARCSSRSTAPPRGIVVTAAAAKLAAERGAAVEVLHVHETDVLGEQAVDRESREMAAAVLARRLAQLQRGRRARGRRGAAHLRRPRGRRPGGARPRRRRSAPRPWSSGREGTRLRPRDASRSCVVAR